MKRNEGVRKLIRYGLTENQNTCVYRMELSNVVHVWRNRWVRNIIICTVMMGLHVTKKGELTRKNQSLPLPYTLAVFLLNKRRINITLDHI